MLWPTQAALGRRRLAGFPSPDSVAREVRIGVEETIFLDVEADAARALIDQLDGLFFENISTRIFNELYDLEFVHHPEPYSLQHNSNHMVARWLEELGCRIEGSATLSRWQLGQTAGGSS
jgi:hypothetical protein